jgi:hypothetical protein
MERTFAGFWRDGALVQPEKRHADSTGYVIGFSKSNKEFYCCHANRPLIWSGYYWLDTTTPTELTPQEAFELLKMIFPMLTGIEKDRQRDYTMKGDRYIEANINWGDTTEYPFKKKWRVPTDTDKGKRCRVKLMMNDFEWKDGVFVFMTTMHPNRFIASDIGGNVAAFNSCEVLDE